MKDAGAMLAAVRGWAHAIEQHLESRLLRAHLVKVVGNEEFVECHSAPLQFGEDRREPLRVLIEKCKRRAIGARDFGSHCAA